MCAWCIFEDAAAWTTTWPIESPQGLRCGTREEISRLAGIGKSTRIHKEMNEEEYVVWERKFRGLCKQSEYYVGRPAKKQVEIEKQVTTYQFQPEKIKVRRPISWHNICRDGSSCPLQNPQP